MDGSATDAVKREIGAEINSDGKQFFDNVVHDNILEALLELTTMVWTYRDRAIIMEEILQEAIGSDKNIAEMIEAYEAGPEVNAKRAAERAELVETVFRSFTRRTQ